MSLNDNIIVNQRRIRSGLQETTYSRKIVILCTLPFSAMHTPIIRNAQPKPKKKKT